MKPYKVFVASVLTIWCAQSSTLSTDVECPGLPSAQGGGPGVASATCMAFAPFNGDPQEFNSFANANVGVGNGEASVFAGVDGFHELPSASASYDAIVTLTVFGGSGAGYLLPINFFGDESILETGVASGSFVGTNPVPPDAPCFSVVSTHQIPHGGCSVIIFGQSNTYTLNLSVEASREGSADASFSNSFEFWDSQGNVLTNVQYTLTGLTLPDTPEPSTGSLAFLGISALAAAIRFRLASIKSASSQASQ